MQISVPSSHLVTPRVLKGSIFRDLCANHSLPQGQAHTRAHTCACVHMNTYTYASKNTHVHVHMHTHKYTCKHANTYSCVHTSHIHRWFQMAQRPHPGTAQSLTGPAPGLCHESVTCSHMGQILLEPETVFLMPERRPFLYQHDVASPFCSTRNQALSGVPSAGLGSSKDGILSQRGGSKRHTTKRSLGQPPAPSTSG